MSFSAIGLVDPKTRWNCGGALRAAYCYNASLIVVSGNRVKRREMWNPALTDTVATHKHIPILMAEKDSLKNFLPKGCVPIAVDLIEGATSLPKYEHPERAMYFFGAEDGTLGKNVTDWCRDIVYIPTETCMNLAATVNVVLYDRMAKNVSR